MENQEADAGQEAADIQSDSSTQSLAAVATQKALSLLARCEQCRAGLERKLLQKGFAKATVCGVLDALEEKGLLSDARFARAWLNSRRIGRAEGRTRLLAELSARGIAKDVSKKAVDDFFEEFDEEEICLRAAQKYLSRGYSGEKLMAAMQRSGFSYKMAARAVEQAR